MGQSTGKHSENALQGTATGTYDEQNLPGDTTTCLPIWPGDSHHEPGRTTGSLILLLFDTLSASLAIRLRKTPTSPVSQFKMYQAGAAFSL
jgi:hypothetical protein